LRLAFWRTGSTKEPAPDTGPAQTIQSEFDAIRQRFVERLREDYGVLSAYASAKRAADPELASTVHRLAGTAGMVGFMEISAAAARLDELLAEPDPEIVPALSEVLRVLKDTLPPDA
jgi:HPt (histidine-containing phosphotransfer) domain-containing protein